MEEYFLEQQRDKKIYARKGFFSPFLEEVSLEAGDTLEYDSPFNEILFILNGEVSLMCEEQEEKRFLSGEMVFLYPGCNCVIKGETQTLSYIFRLDENIDFCSKFSFHQLLPLKGTERIYFHSLSMNDRTKDFVVSLQIYKNDEILSFELMDLKVTEYYFLLHTYYSKENLALFFSPLLHDNYWFYEFVLKSYQQVKTAKELAALSGYTASAFDKEFRAIFGLSPSEWMTQMKMNHIVGELKYTNKSLLEIAQENGFKTITSFASFCQKHRGLSPDMIRRGKKMIN